MTTIAFDATQVAPENSAAFKPLPNGPYVMQITAEAVKPSASGGAFLELELTVVQGDHARRKVYDRLNLRNDNPQAVEIGKARLSAICHAIGLLQLADTNQLIGKSLVVELGQEIDKVSRQPTGRNRVYGYTASSEKPLSEQGIVGAAARAQQAGHSDIPF